MLHTTELIEIKIAIEIDEGCRPEIDRAWDRIEQRLAALPASLAALGRRFLAERRPGGSHRDYFSDLAAAPLLYLPLWMRAALRRAGSWPADAPEEFVGDLLCATMWGYFYIRIQDDVLDERGADARGREQLLFGNVCVHEMARLFDAATGGAPAFRAQFERAWIEFTRCTLEERAQLQSDEPYPRDRFEAHAAKVAFAEAPLLAVCARADRGDLAVAVAELVHRLGVACGLLNDARGFARDVKNGHRTYLLARAGWERAGATAGCGNDEALPEELRARLYEGGLLGTFYSEAREALQRSADAARALGFGPEFERYRARQERTLDDAERGVLTLSLLRALGPRS